MNFKDGIILPTKALRKCGPYLEKYFGITLGYFRDCRKKNKTL